jgi:hypothetical protein
MVGEHSRAVISIKNDWWNINRRIVHWVGITSAMVPAVITAMAVAIVTVTNLDYVGMISATGQHWGGQNTKYANYRNG